MTHHNHQWRTIHCCRSQKPYTPSKYLSLMVIMENKSWDNYGDADDHNTRCQYHSCLLLHPMVFIHQDQYQSSPKYINVDACMHYFNVATWKTYICLSQNIYNLHEIINRAPCSTCIHAQLSTNEELG